MPYKDPERRRASVRESQRRRRAVAGKPRRHPRPLPELAELRLRSARDVVAAIEEQLDLVRRARVGVLERARCVGYLCSVALRATEVGSTEERIDELERLFGVGGSGGDDVQHPRSS